MFSPVRCPLSRLTWDKQSREHFDPATVQVENFSTASVLTLKNRNLISLTGAPSYSKILCDYVGSALELTIVNDRLFEVPYRMSVLEGTNMTYLLVIHLLKIHPSLQRKQIAARMFWCTAKACSKLRISKINVQGLAAFADTSSSGENWSGAATAVSLGFDGKFPDEIRHDAPKSLQGLRTVREVVQTPEGASWWKANPQPLNLFFDTSPKSTSMKILRSYIRSRNIHLSQ